MKRSIVEKHGISQDVIALIGRLVGSIPWPAKRQAMGDVAVSILDGKARVAETVFGWGRNTVELGMNEYRTGIVCVNDLSSRCKPKWEAKYPELVEAIHRIMEPQSQAHSHLNTTLLYTNKTAKSVWEDLQKSGLSQEAIPAPRTLSNILNRLNYRLRRVEKSQVKKNAVYRRNLRERKAGQCRGR